MSAFVIIGTQRTGTTLIRTSLDSHPHIRCSGEVFKTGRRPYLEPDGYWAYCHRTARSRIMQYLFRRRHVYRFLDNLLASADGKSPGFKMMYSHARRHPAAIDYVKTNRIKAVHVTRRNVLKTLLSRELARQTGVYHHFGEKQHGEVEAIHLETGDLPRRLRNLVNEDREWQGLLYGHVDVHRVCYEVFVNDHESASRQLLMFLGLEYLDLTSNLTKLNPTDMRRLIRNYDEVANALRDSEFAELLDAPGP